MFDDVPQKLTDAWADWVVRKLAVNGETALTDEDIAAIIQNTKSITRVMLGTLIGNASDASAELAAQYTDNAVEALRVSFNGSISSGDIRAVNSAKSYADAQDVTTLAAAKAYTDTHSGSGGGVSQSYVDAGDKKAFDNAVYAANSSISQLREYVNTADASTLSAANAELTRQLANYVSRGTFDAYVATVDATIRSVAGQLDTAVLEAANAYTDAHAGGGDNGDYVDEQVGQARADLLAAIDTARGAAVQSASEYTDDAIDLASGGTSALIDGKIADLTTYVDNQDSYILNQAKAYTDNNGAGAVTKNYVDQQDTSTLNQSKTYADQYAKPPGGWAKTDLSSSVQSSLSKADDDTGWVAVTPIVGYRNGSSIFARRKNGTVRHRGSLVADSSATIGTVTAVFVTPFKPAQGSGVGVVCPGSGTANAKVYANTSTGNVDITPQSGTSNYINLDALSYFSD